MGRKILAVLVGAVVAIVVVFVFEYISSLIYPPPPGLNMSDVEAMKEHVKTLPLGAFIFVLVAWTLGAFIGGLVAGIIAKSNHVLFGWIIGAIILIGAIVTVVTIPHPAWFSVAGAFLFLLASFMSGKVGACMKSAPPAQA
jgi:MFS family permease